MSTEDKVLIALMVMSSRFPMGVPITYNPGANSVLFVLIACFV